MNLLFLLLFQMVFISTYDHSIHPCFEGTLLDVRLLGFGVDDWMWEKSVPRVESLFFPQLSRLCDWLLFCFSNLHTLFLSHFFFPSNPFLSQNNHRRWVKLSRAKQTSTLRWSCLVCPMSERHAFSSAFWQTAMLLTPLRFVIRLSHHKTQSTDEKSLGPNTDHRRVIWWKAHHCRRQDGCHRAVGHRRLWAVRVHDADVLPRRQCRSCLLRFVKTLLQHLLNAEW